MAKNWMNTIIRPDDEHISRAVALLRQARYVVALTGAGISTASGIPDFRSPGSGMWEQYDPMEVASIYAFRQHPDKFYDWIRPLVMMMLTARPNAGHQALADLETLDCLRAVITQNIDGLHQAAGTREVLELHGHFREATCVRCYQTLPSQALLNDFLASGEVPRCAACGGVMKPNAVLFGEQLPVRVVNAAMAHVRRADVMLVAGSSLEVLPAANIPLEVRERGGRLIVVNLTPTYVDEWADVVIHADVADVLPRIVEQCREVT
jgi:NAD-dependent deacetylase